MASTKLAPDVAGHLIEREEYVNLMQHPKVSAAIQKLKTDPGCFTQLCADDEELAGLFGKMQAQVCTHACGCVCVCACAPVRVSCRVCVCVVCVGVCVCA